MIDLIRWHGHASFSIESTPRIMIDPWGILPDDSPPDIILISHEHYDHCSPADVEKLRGANTQVIASSTAAEQLDGPVTVLRPWQAINFGRTSIKTVPAYTYKGDHPAYREDLGFIISQNYTDIYYAGDTDFIPELRNIRCDIAILPISSRDGVLSTQSSLELIETIRPRYVIPSHISNHPASGGRLELKAFQRNINGLVDVVSLSEFKGTTVAPAAFN